MTTYKTLCGCNPDFYVKVVRIYDEFGFIITPLKKGMPKVIASHQTYLTETDAWEEAYKMIQ
jgi:hypothetical protein